MPNPNIKDPLVPKQNNSALDSLPEVDWRSRLRMTATKAVPATYTTETIAQMQAWLKEQCSRLTYGQCTTARCLKRGGYNRCDLVRRRWL